MTSQPETPHTVTIVGPDGQRVGQMEVHGADGTEAGRRAGLGGQQVGQMEVPVADGTEERSPADMVEQPAKVMRIGSMVKQLLGEVRAAPLDDGARTRLREIYESSIKELSEGLAPELREELDR